MIGFAVPNVICVVILGMWLLLYQRVWSKSSSWVMYLGRNDFPFVLRYVAYITGYLLY